MRTPTRTAPCLLLACLAVACGGGSGEPDASARDAGHDAGNADVDEASTPLFDTGAPLPEGGSSRCGSLGAVWARMDKQPILLSDPARGGHRYVGGVDMDGPSGTGATIPEVEAVLCAGTPLGAGPAGTLLEAWGGSEELQLAYTHGTLTVQQVDLLPGYAGTMDLPTDPAGPDRGHTFRVGLGQPTLDGAPFVIDWTDVNFTAGNRLYNALLHSSGSDPGWSSTPCPTSGACTITTSAGRRVFTVVAVSAAFLFKESGTPAEESTVVEIDMAP